MQLPKHVIERLIPGAGKHSPSDLKAISQKPCSVLRKMGPQIQWVHSCVTDDKIYCVHVAPNEATVRKRDARGPSGQFDCACPHGHRAGYFGGLRWGRARDSATRKARVVARAARESPVAPERCRLECCRRATPGLVGGGKGPPHPVHPVWPPDQPVRIREAWARQKTLRRSTESHGPRARESEPDSARKRSRAKPAPAFDPHPTSDPHLIDPQQMARWLARPRSGTGDPMQ